jgi:hypothetical protein
MRGGEAEAFEIEHAERAHDGARAAGGLELVGGQVGDEPRGGEVVQRVNGGLLVRGGFPGFERAFGDDQLGGVQGGEDGQEIFGAGVGGDFEFAGGEIEPGGVEAGFVEGEGAEVVVARGVELVGGQGRARTEDTRELAFDEFAGFGGLGLVADGDFFPGGEELADVVVGRVKGQAGHGRLAALGEGQPEEA